MTTEQKVVRAKKAAAATKKIATGKTRTIRTNVHFFRPKTKTTKRAPKVPKKSVNKQNKMDKYRILKSPLTTESAMKKIEEINTLVFLCDVKATKRQIKEAVSSMYEVKCKKINTLITPKGNKKAYVHLTSDYDALDVANRIGVI